VSYIFILIQKLPLIEKTIAKVIKLQASLRYNLREFPGVITEPKLGQSLQYFKGNITKETTKQNF
jgi:hypothetical protein